VRRNRRESFRRVDEASQSARGALQSEDSDAAARALLPPASSAQMAEALWLLMAQYGQAGAGDRMNKCLADFDLRSLRRLERSRLMVRFGPALGLMGTLIPLSPALAGLAKGNVNALAENLRVAFSITVVGLLVGAIAFAISLVRGRRQDQDRAPGQEDRHGHRQGGRAGLPPRRRTARLRAGQEALTAAAARPAAWVWKVEPKVFPQAAVDGR